MKVKTCPVAIKAPGGNENTNEGVFEAIVATYDVDSVGDQIVPGAFKKSIETWEGSGNPIPVVWAHQSNDPFAHIGFVTKAAETPSGLKVEGQLDLENPMAMQVYRMLKGRRVTNFSFAYDEIDARPAEKSSGAQKELHELKIYEVGPCLVGANQATSLVAVKHDLSSPTVTGQGASGQVYVEVKEQADSQVEALSDAPDCKSCGPSLQSLGEKFAAIATAYKTSGALSKEHQEEITSLFAATAAGMEAIGNLLAALPAAGDDPDGEKATPAQPAPAPPVEAKSEPARHGTASVRNPLPALLDVLELEQAIETY